MSVQRKNKNTPVNRQILLDTTVFFCLLDMQYRYRVYRWLQGLKAGGNSLFFSDITRFELTRRVDFHSKKQERVVLRLLDKLGIPNLPITQYRLTNAAILCRAMYPHRLNEGQKKQIIADMIVGGTVIENPKALLMTADRNDFQEPWWHITTEKYFTRKRSEGWELENIFLLNFNYKALPLENLSAELRAVAIGQQSLSLE